MRRASGPSLLSLLERAAVSLGLIARAAWLYLCLALHNRGLWKRDPARLLQMQHDFARRFVRVATRFRGGLIKLGQLASLRVDVVPEEVTAELASLQDRVPPHPYAEIELQIERELGGPVAEHFSTFAREPIASASLGQVHRATLPDGRDVAVKVLYPGIERSVAVDLAMTRLGLWLFNRVTVGDLMQVYRELRESLLGEMDYRREGRAAEEVAGNLARDPLIAERVRIPAIHWPTTTGSVLTMEFIEGVKINDREAVAALGASIDDAVLWATRAFLHMMFRDGFFHCDPHPGNLLVDSEGRVGIVDFGMNKRIEPRVLDAFRKNVMASVTRDVDAYAESLVEGGVVDAADAPVVKEIAALSFDPRYYNLTPSEVMQLDWGQYVKRMRGEMKRLKSFRLPDGIVMWSRAFTLLFGLSNELAPGLRPLDVVGPYALEFMAGGRPAPPAPAAPPAPVAPPAA